MKLQFILGICLILLPCIQCYAESNISKPNTEQNSEAQILANKLSSQLEKLNFPICVTDSKINDKGLLILVLKENQYFSEGSKIIIPPEIFEEIEFLAGHIRTSASVTKRSSNSRIKTISFNSEFIPTIECEKKA
jgi:hypothetical protein